MDSFLSELLQYQPNRVHAIGFLATGSIIQFFRLHTTSSGLVLEETPVYFLIHGGSDGGGPLFKGLLSSPASPLGLTQTDLTIAKEEVIIQEVLGIGGSAVVYCGQYKKKDVVVKTFRPEHKSRLQCEVKALENVSSLIPNVPKYVATSDDGSSIVLTPIGKHFPSSRLDLLDATLPLVNCNHFHSLLLVLQETHKLGFVHRDIKLSNFFERIDAEDEILLNDWTCTAEVEKETTFEGALTHAPHRILQILQKDRSATYAPRPSDDLEMVVKCVFQSLYSTAFLRIAGESNPATLAEHWEHFLSPPLWEDMLIAARRCLYRKLAELISRLLPLKHEMDLEKFMENEDEDKEDDLV